MKRIEMGVRRFQQSHFKNNLTLFKRLEKSQEPDILFITCSDSRVVPHKLTKSKPGDLFVIRNAGNLVPVHDTKSSEAATIEYALKALDINEIIICGHSQCGAMTGLLHPEKISEMTYVKAWLSHADSTLRRAQSKLFPKSKPEQLKTLIEINVIQQIEHLKTHPCVIEKLKKGTLTIHGWVYHIGSGQVDVYDSSLDAFKPLVVESHAAPKSTPLKPEAEPIEEHKHPGL